MRTKSTVLAFALACSTMAMARPAAAAVTFGREKLKATTKTQGDFNLSNRFSFEIDGVIVAGVHTVDGLMERLYERYQEGGKNEGPRAVALVVEPVATATKEQLVGRSALAELVCGAVAGDAQRKSISVIFYDDAGKELNRAIFRGARAVSWEPHKAPGLDLPEQERSSAHATESITIVYETMELK